MSKDAIKRIINKDIKEINKMELDKLGIHIEFNEDDMLKVEEYCLQFAERFFLKDVNWISWSDFSKDLPILSSQKNLFLKRNRKFELEDSTSRYFLFIQDFSKDFVKFSHFLHYYFERISVCQSVVSHLHRVHPNQTTKPIEQHRCSIRK